MAKFSPPWASVGGVVRSPTVDEQNDGFPCGPLDLDMWNRLFQRIEAELQAILDEGGITGTEEDDTGVLQAIQAMIAAATGGGDTSNFVLFTQAQARLPIFPEVTTNSGVIAVTAPSTGTVRVPASATVLHRGIRTITTSQTDLATTASKTYHLRCAISAGTLTFSLKDLADTGSYNPSALAETDTAFDSTYDDMLVARVVTNSSNVATITNLTNKASLAYDGTQDLTPTAGADNSWYADHSVTLNWARRPRVIAVRSSIYISMPDNAGFVHGGANHSSNEATTRYAHSHRVTTDWASTPGGIGAKTSHMWASFGA